MTVVTSGILVLSCLLIGTKEGSGHLFEPICGYSRSVFGYEGSQVSGVQSAHILSHPWMVMIIGSETCGGSLINSQFVLTSADCLSDGHMKVRLGEFETTNSRDDCSSGSCIPTAYEIDVDKKIRHRDFDGSKNDIGLLRLAKTVQYSEYVMPICLLVNEQVEYIRLFKATSWGHTEHGRLGSSLQVATIENINRRDCNWSLNSTHAVSQICARGLHRVECAGNPGGPLSAERYYEGVLRVFQFGVIRNAPSPCTGLRVHTNVTHFTTWISQVVNTFKY
ncbi:melanization protease 1-like [Drosophila biarmipes]|uniref:melanization protease 1-like n=1 Tax=Drosophila biarmipes TaxID=125945 RepID=UPI0021CC6375|nr:melanization protease 1-like [Drosophila biarmipes]